MLVGEDQTGVGAVHWGREQEDGEKSYLGTGMGAWPALLAYHGGDKSCPSCLPPWSLLQFLPLGLQLRYDFLEPKGAPILTHR